MGKAPKVVKRKPTPTWQNWPTRAWIDVTGPVRDRHGGAFSATKLLAFFIAYLGGYSIKELHGVISMNALWMELAAMSAAFGKSTFNFILSKISRTDTVSDSESRVNERKFSRQEIDVHVDETKRLISERRIEDGSPPRSMPPVGATAPE